MTDLEKLKALLTEWGVNFSQHSDSSGIEVMVAQETGGPKVGGYNCFFTTFDFDNDGTFKTMGAWED